MNRDYSSSFKVQEFSAHTTSVNCLSIGPKSNEVLATGGADCKVNIWRVGSTSNVWTLSQNKSPVECLCFDPEEQYVVSGTTNGSIKMFDLNVGKLARTLTGHHTRIGSVQYHPYGEFAVSGSDDCTMKVWDLKKRECIQTYNGHTKEITCVRFSPDGKWVASASKDGQMRLWDLVAGKLISSIKLQQPTFVRTFEFNPAEFTLAAATSMRTVKFWDLDTMEPIGTTTSETNQIQSIAYSSLGSSLCIASKDMLKVWDLENNLNMRGAIEVSGWDNIQDMKLSNNLQLVAGSCISNFVSVWSVDLQEVLAAQKEAAEESGADVNKDRFSTKTSASTKSNVSAVSKKDAKNESPMVPPSRGNQQQLNDVRRQLNQLSDDLNSNGALRGAQDKLSAPPRGPSIVRRDPNTPSEPAYPREAVTGRASQRYAESKGDEGFGDDDKSAYDYDRRRSDKASSDETPDVVWDNGSRSQEMATSMGESFMRRFKDSGHLAEEPQQCKPVYEGYEEDSDFEDADEMDDVDRLEYEMVQRLSHKEDVGIPDHELEGLLPLSSFKNYDDYPSTAAAPKTADSVSSKAPMVRRSPLGADLPDEAPVVRKGVTPAFPKRQATPASASDLRNNPAQLALGGAPIEVVGMRNLRSPAAAANDKAPVRSNGESDAKKVGDLLDHLATDSGPVKSALVQRLQSLKMLRMLWERGEVRDAIAHLTALSDGMPHAVRNLSTLADFFEAIDLQGNGLSLDSCLGLLPVLEAMVSASDGWKSEHVMYAIFKSMVSLAEVFGELIRSTRATIVVAGGVDLSREMRLNKCNTCHGVFVRVDGRVEQLRRHFRASTTIVRVLDTYHDLCTRFFCN